MKLINIILVVFVLALMVIFGVAITKNNKTTLGPLSTNRLIKSTHKTFTQPAPPILPEKATPPSIDTLQEDTYLVSINIKQSHFTLDPTVWITDDANSTEITFPTTKTFYDSVHVGQIINNEFRSGSFWMKGSIGNWNITVSNKQITKKRIIN